MCFVTPNLLVGLKINGISPTDDLSNIMSSSGTYILRNGVTPLGMYAVPFSI